jgi:hypothetical protein
MALSADKIGQFRKFGKYMSNFSTGAKSPQFVVKKGNFKKLYRPPCRILLQVSYHPLLREQQSSRLGIAPEKFFTPEIITFDEVSKIFALHCYCWNKNCSRYIKVFAL